MISVMTLPRALAAIAIILSYVPGVRARRCYRNRIGRLQCNGLSRGARIGIAIGIAIFLLSLIALIICILHNRRRRLQRSSGLPPPVMGGPPYEKPVQQPDMYQPYPDGAGQEGQYNYAAPSHSIAAPQFPTPTYQGGGYIPANGPPQTYAPPSEPPPAK
ncbi:hypothetical protein CTheo_2567 [Ceratobasidium theobromae]|uniref:Transmembrane protein n=1 Tax=Ceratobasidium theobromae TaxID=1582974 RepID=A0A5N5QS18_9AGAM|nr:hypothetical protein CTheo_2567 [Ceratobasidium theobromae]